MTSSAAPAHSHKKLSGYCSICWCEDGKKGKHLQDCCECGVLFHNECYGRADVDYDPTVRCWACAAVGTTVKGRALDGSRHDLLITERPTECALCSANPKDVPLAMHPLYDDHGVKGRQLILRHNSNKAATTTKDSKSQQQQQSLSAAWCHTLCAQFICVYARTAGCVFGCRPSGCYMGDDDIEVQDDERSINADLARIKPDTDEDNVGIHHFVVVLPTWRGENEWTKAIAEAKRHLICYICKKRDDRPDTVRFVVQCSANEPTEIAGKGLHKTKMEQCAEAMHVGCAIWTQVLRGNWPLHRQVYFFPGKEDDEAEVDPVVDIYCCHHAKDIACHKSAWKCATYRRFPEPNDKFPKHKATVDNAATLATTSPRSQALPTASSPKRRPSETAVASKKRTNDAAASAPLSSTKPPGSSNSAILDRCERDVKPSSSSSTLSVAGTRHTTAVKSLQSYTALLSKNSAKEPQPSLTDPTNSSPMSGSLPGRSNPASNPVGRSNLTASSTGLAGSAFAPQRAVHNDTAMPSGHAGAQRLLTTAAASSSSHVAASAQAFPQSADASIMRSEHASKDGTDPPKKKRYKRSELVVRKGPNDPPGAGLILRRGSPVHMTEKRDWSSLLVGPNYDPTFSVLKLWDTMEPVDPDDISDS